MIVERQCPITGAVNQMDLPINEVELARWRGGELIQNVWPHLSDDEREFIKTGITPEVWDMMFPDE